VMDGPDGPGAQGEESGLCAAYGEMMGWGAWAECMDRERWLGFEAWWTEPARVESKLFGAFEADCCAALDSFVARVFHTGHTIMPVCVIFVKTRKQKTCHLFSLEEKIEHSKSSLFT
jgi:hypothetical protein